MKNFYPVICLFCLLPLFLAGCGLFSSDLPRYRGPHYPPARKVTTIFQAKQAAPQCRVFAELFITLPSGVNGSWIREKVEAEAKQRGANMLLIGHSRQMEDDEGLSFLYHGPDREYICTEQWCGWKSGFDVWEEQGELVSMGLEEWGNSKVSYESPLMMQAAFLRCQP